ncbi:hypothetical protein DBY65_017335 [Pseudomonas sp. RIT412]|nr:hypothetical protein DBP26_010515 [Pseudomonas sp. RIT 409]RAU52398.1 hypothetical protein DBY65_017335 [Pseudomonas sp. RIT 412]
MDVNTVVILNETTGGTETPFQAQRSRADTGGFINLARRISPMLVIETAVLIKILYVAKIAFVMVQTYKAAIK